MFTYDDAQYNWEKGYYSLVKNKDGRYCLFSTKDSDGDLRYSGWWTTEKQVLKYFSDGNGYIKKRFNDFSKADSWQLVRTIHPNELMGEGFKVGDRVKILPNAKEECEKYSLSFFGERQKVADKGFGKITNIGSLDYKIDGWIFPLTALAPYQENPHSKETIENAKRILREAGEI